MTIHSLQSSVFSEQVIARLTHSIVLSKPWQSSDIVYKLAKALLVPLYGKYAIHITYAAYLRRNSFFTYLDEIRSMPEPEFIF
jgi:hypothetical protein